MVTALFSPDVFWKVKNLHKGSVFLSWDLGLWESRRDLTSEIERREKDRLVLLDVNWVAV